jgi:hypothetical protein
LIEQTIASGSLSPEMQKLAVDLGIAIDVNPSHPNNGVDLISYAVVVIVEHVVKNTLDPSRLLILLYEVINICRTHCQGEPDSWTEYVESNFAQDEWDITCSVRSR